jgi:ferredoxin-NADP reductase
MPTKWNECELISSKELTPQTRLFTFKLLGDEVFSFKAGQFITFDLPVHEKRLYRWKSYSLANAPDNTNHFELCIVKNEGGLGTTYLFDQIIIGDKLKFKGPEGSFILPENRPETICFICTGTGIAPFRSMLWDICQQPVKASAIRVIFGTRKMENVLFLDEWRELVKLLPDFQVHIALSRDEELPLIKEKNIFFYKGYVHQIYQHQKLFDAKEPIFYLCGWRNMIDEAQKNLLNLGFPSSHIQTELYG